MLDLKDYRWVHPDVSPPAELRGGKFMVLLFWPLAQQINISRAKYYRVKDTDFWGSSYRLTFAEQGAQVMAWAPAQQVFIEKEVSAA